MVVQLLQRIMQRLATSMSYGRIAGIDPCVDISDLSQIDELRKKRWERTNICLKEGYAIQRWNPLRHGLKESCLVYELERDGLHDKV